MQRRTFIKHLGGAAAAAAYCSLAGRAAYAASSPVRVVGFLSATTQEPERCFAALRRGLNETGFQEGQTVAIEYRWAEDKYDRLPTISAELSRRDDVGVIVAANYPAAVAAKKTTKTIPIVFLTAIDPVTSGLVGSLNRPDGNATGVHILNGLLEAKRLEILQQQVVSGSGLIAVLVNPKFPMVERQISDILAASRALKVSTLIVRVSSESDLREVFGTLAAREARGLVVTTDPFLYTYRKSIVKLSEHYRIPAIYPFADFVEVGGLMSYGTDLPSAYYLLGGYAGRILKGEKVADLPVQQSTKVALTLNFKTAKALGITFSETLEGRADEVIE
jgi:putative ABC transport system substrate-binding protein